MKVLLVGEASGVHRNLKQGLKALGVECLHMVHSDTAPRRSYDDAFSYSYGGLLGGLARNLQPFIKISALPRFDVINFCNTITSVHGIYTKYLDLPALRKKTKIMSYYALGCDEIGLIRANNALPYAPCTGCLKSGDVLSRDCSQILYPRVEKSKRIVNKYFDFAACSMVEYGHTEQLFGRDFARIQLPVDTDKIPFAPARNRKIVHIVHTPTRRGFKGTAVVLRAIDLLKKWRDDFVFSIIEGLQYDKYLSAMADADIVIDQVYSQSMGMNALEMLAAGKIVFTGSTDLGNSYFEFSKATPAFDAPPESEGLARALSSVIDRKSEFGVLASSGRRYVEEHHSIPSVAQLFLNKWNEKLT